MDWYEYENEIPLSTLKVWRETILATCKFKFEGWTGISREPYRHWASYPEYEEYYKNIFSCLNESVEYSNLSVDRVIVNMYNHGDSSWLHRDTTDSKGVTVLLFMNEYWDNNWGGDFIIEKNNKIAYATYPTPGKYVAFRSNLNHAARPVSREAQFPRMAVAFQCTEQLKI